MNNKKWHETSPAQKRMYALYEFDNYSISYNIMGAWYIKNKITEGQLEKYLKELIKRHDILRTSYSVINGEIMQMVSDQFTFSLEIYENADEELILNQFARPFDLEKVPPMRAGMIKNQNQNIFVLDIHHIAADGVSIEILLEELEMIHSGNKLVPQTVNYCDYAELQNKRIREGNLKQQELFWKNLFLDGVPCINMPCDYGRSSVKSKNGGTEKFKLNGETVMLLYKLSNSTLSSMYMILLSAFCVLLSKYSHQNDIVIGTTMSGRHSSDIDIENIVGLFANTVVIRSQPCKDKKFLDYLSEIKEIVYDAYANQDYPFDILVEQLNIPKSVSHNPIFDVMFTMQTEYEQDKKIKSINFLRYDFLQLNSSQFDLSLNIHESPEGITGAIDYCTDLYNQDTIKLMVEHFCIIIDDIVRNFQNRLSEIEMLTVYEEEQILKKFNSPKITIEEKYTVLNLFESQVLTSPESVAIIFEDKFVTYGELQKKVNSIAVRLQKLRLRENTLVPFIFERNIDSIAGILGILKAGGICVPVDSSLKQEKIEFCVKDTNAEIIVTNLDKIEISGVDIVFINQNISIEEHLDTHFFKPLCNEIEGQAYGIYNFEAMESPKLVLVSHKNLVNYILYMIKKFAFSDLSIALQYFTHSCEIALSEIFPALLSGGKIIMFPDEVRMDFNILRQCIRDNKITFVTSTPPILNELNNLSVDGEETVQYYLSIGEQLLYNDISSLIMKSAVYNMYGLPEMVGGVTLYEVNKNSSRKIIPIGKPIDNIRIYIIEDKSLCGIGIIGEICLAGAVLGKVDSGKKELIDEVLTQKLNVSDNGLYRTGVLAKWLPDGNIFLVGRKDNQVKLQGYQFSLKEIECAIRAIKGITACIVVSIADKEKMYHLYAYYTASQSLSSDYIRESLTVKLPGYMIPKKFIQVKRIPLKSNGRFDFNKLPDLLDSKQQVFQNGGSINLIESKIIQILKNSLGCEHINPYDNFFDVGGSSLKAIKVVMEIKNNFGIKVPVIKILRDCSVKSIVELVKKYMLKLHNNGTVLLKQGINKKNVFIIHDISGEVTGYKDLISALNDYSTYYGFCYIYPELENQSDIVSLANNYINLIKNIQSEGEYCLIGWSLGGVIAYEMASQLEKRGDVVAKLILIDSRLHQEEADDDVDDSSAILRAILGNDLEGSEEEYYDLYNIISTLLRVYDDYSPQNKINVPIHYCRPIDEGINVEPQWNELCDGQIVLHKISGNHFSTMKMPYVLELAKIIDEQLKSN